MNKQAAADKEDYEEALNVKAKIDELEAKLNSNSEAQKLPQQLMMLLNPLNV